MEHTTVPQMLTISSVADQYGPAPQIKYDSSPAQFVL